MKIIIGSRDSKLALIQTEMIKAQLLALEPNLEIEIIKVKSEGDLILDTPLAQIPQGDVKGLFTKELEHALLAETIDMAVHSMKDLPTTLPAGLEIACTSKREDVRDVVCMSQRALHEGIDHISKARVVGTSSPRRIAQLKRLYPQVEFKDMRGNLATRFRKLDVIASEGDQVIASNVTSSLRAQRSNPHAATVGSPRGCAARDDVMFDAIVLAAAGVKRQGLEDRITQYLDPRQVLPAIGQGALAVEIKTTSAKSQRLRELLASINSHEDDLIVRGERAFLRALQGGCSAPVGIYAQLERENLSYIASVTSTDGTKELRAEISGSLNAAETLGEQLAERMLADGAADLMSS